MPKDKSSHYHSQKVRDYSCRPYRSSGLQGAPLPDKCLDEDAPAFRNDWECVVCPVCMEIPHNAVLLHCSSYNKGCRPFMCDTSYRHSNCFDQYLKAHLASRKDTDSQGGTEVTRNIDVLDGLPSGLESTEQEVSPQLSFPEPIEEREFLQRWRFGAQQVSKSDFLGLACPLCRGNVKGCEVVKRARDLLNRKTRVCARERCSFSGSYQELRAHARRDHPCVRPAEIDPARQRSWVRLERQQELGDVLSAIQSSMPHATVSGDYAIDGEDDSVDNVESTLLSEDGNFLTLFLSFQMFGSVNSFLGGRPLPPFRGVLRRHRRSGNSRQGLWGEILQQGHSSDSNDNFAANHPQDRSQLERINHHRHR